MTNEKVKLRTLPQPSLLPGAYFHAPVDMTVGDYLESYCSTPDVIGLDTEDGPDGTWSVQVSGDPGSAIIILTSNPNSIARLNAFIVMHSPLVVMHNALYDLPKIQALGITPAHITDTMVMAYLLQNEPLGLKALAWKHANVKMRNYVEMIRDARNANGLAYLHAVCALDWDDPEPVIVYEKGIPKIKQPQNVGKKARRIVGDVEKGKVTKDGPVEPRGRWLKIKPEDGRQMVEDVLGPMPDGYLCDIDFEDAKDYGCCDADMTLQVYHSLYKRLDDMGMLHLMVEEEGVMNFANMMHVNGIPADKDGFARLSAELGGAMDKKEKEIRDVSGFQGQLSSHPQVSKLIYDDLGLRPHMPKQSKKMGATMTGDQVLAQLEHLHPAVGMIREYRKLEKLKNTYADGVPRFIGEDGRIHAEFRTTNTDTGRVSCANPNLMAQPKRNKDWAKKLRECFIAPPGWRFVSMDYSQIELRLTAHTANEEGMINAFLAGVDLHALTAYEMFITPGKALPIHVMRPAEIERELGRIDKLTQRLPAKTINFGIIYGISAAGLYRNMITTPGCEHWTEKLAQEYIDLYLSARPGIRGYIDETVSMARRYGYVWDWAGRIRRIPGAKLVNDYKRAEAERQACNARIQTGAQSIIKSAMHTLSWYYKEWVEKEWATPAIQIHDDIVSIVREDRLADIIPVQKEIMETAKTLKTGVRVDVEVGQDWGHMEDWEGEEGEG
jgi:DNA polymerase I-like protein with 3'-5' exonuclease and polymerase domains